MQIDEILAIKYEMLKSWIKICSARYNMFFYTIFFKKRLIKKWAYIRTYKFICLLGHDSNLDYVI